VANKKFIIWLIGSLTVLIGIGCIFLICDDFPRGARLLLLFSCLIAGLRVLIGPTGADRVVALNMTGLLIIGFCSIMAVFTGASWYIDIALVWALETFIFTLVLAKFLQGKRFEE